MRPQEDQGGQSWQDQGVWIGTVVAMVKGSMVVVSVPMVMMMMRRRRRRRRKRMPKYKKNAVHHHKQHNDHDHYYYYFSLNNTYLLSVVLVLVSSVYMFATPKQSNEQVESHISSFLRASEPIDDEEQN